MKTMTLTDFIEMDGILFARKINNPAKIYKKKKNKWIKATWMEKQEYSLRLKKDNYGIQSKNK